MSGDPFRRLTRRDLRPPERGRSGTANIDKGKGRPAGTTRSPVGARVATRRKASRAARAARRANR